MASESWLAGSAIEPETSITSSDPAALRCCSHGVEQLDQDGRLGHLEHVWGWFGSTPLAGVIGSPMATDGLPGRKLYCSTLAWFSGCCTKSSKSCAACCCSAVTQGASRTKKGLSEKSVPSFG